MSLHDFMFSLQNLGRHEVRSQSKLLPLLRWEAFRPDLPLPLRILRHLRP